MISFSIIDTEGAPVLSEMMGRAEGTHALVERIQRVLGEEVVLLPVPKGEKGPKTKDWQETTLERMSDPAYLKKLSSGNIGVLLGKPSGNVCAIDIDDDAAVEPFLEKNPKLKETLRTRGARGCQLWVRPTDTDVPETKKLTAVDGKPWGEWRGGGGQSIIHGLHPEGMEYRWLVDAPAVSIAFDDLVWPENLKLPWGDKAYRELVAEVGEPMDGKAINPSFFSRVFMMKNAVAKRRGSLCIYNSNTGLWAPRQDSEVEGELWKFTRRFMDDLAVSPLKPKLRQKTIGEVKEMLMIESETMPEDSAEGVMHVKNGMLDLKRETPALLEFSPDFRSLQRVELDYVPDAKCPRFKEWLKGSMSTDDIALFQEWFGAVLLGPNLAQRFLLINGEASSGKSSLVTLVEKFVGRDSCCQLRVGQLGGRFEAREYANKRLLTGKDVPVDFLSGKHTAILKSLVGGDLLTAERKGENEGVSYRGDFHVVIVSNEELVLRIEGDADAWERRLLSIQMTKPERFDAVPDIASVLFREEGEGILAWAVEGAKGHFTRKYQYALSENQTAKIQRIVDASDGPGLFVVQRLAVDENGQGMVTMEQLAEAYDQFAKEYDLERFKKEQLGRKLVPLILSRLGLNQSRHIPNPCLREGTELRGYRGLVILP